MQAQYFWEGHDPSSPAVDAATTERDITVPRFLGLRGRRAAAHANANMCHVIAGPLIPIEPGETVTTQFTMDEDSVWHASISTGSKISAIEVPYEYMERNQTWGKTIGLGTCMEVDNLMGRDYYPPTCPVRTSVAPQPTLLVPSS